MAEDSDARACSEETRRHDRPRWLCALLAESRVRTELHALHAFHHEIERIPSLVSEIMPGLIRFQWWREAIVGLGKGQAAEPHPVLRCLAVPLRDGRLGPEDLLALIESAEERFLTACEQEAATEKDIVTPPMQGSETQSGAVSVLGLRLIGLPASGGLDETMQAARAVGTAYGLCRTLVRSGDEASSEQRHAIRQLLENSRARQHQMPREALPVLALARFCDLTLSRKETRSLRQGREPFILSGPWQMILAALSGRY